MNFWIGSEPLFYPTLSGEVQTFVRLSYGVLLLATLIRLVPDARRYFLSERWGGYGQRGWRVELVQNPVVLPAVMLIWIAAAVLLVAGRYTVAAAAICALFGYYFFIAMRWRSVLRGMGAPGFITYWLGAAVFVLELTREHAASARGLALLTLQVDFALIMLAAGIYKAASGYRQNEGMELGMANPEWGLWSGFWRQVSPHHPFFRFLNWMAWSTEVVAGVLMLIPETRFLGGLLILCSFVFVATQIRLGFLCEMVVVCCLLFFHPGSVGDRVISSVVAAQAAAPVGDLWPRASLLLMVALSVYLALLPFARAGLSYNLHAKKPVPLGLQPLLDAYTNLFGLILWRVFSADLINFFIQIYEQSPTGTRRLVSRWGRAGRFNMVAEAIVVTTAFTTLKYYPSNRRIFDDRLLRYARTVPHHAASVLVFQHVSVLKTSDEFAYSPSAEFTVDVAQRTIDEVTLDPSALVRAPIAVSPLHEGIRPGSYVPLKQ